ncbi:TIR domain-containing protein, partial [Streptomyces sp. KR55]|uniref:TIR domain-containing protein n=1 Tax=Streptomyces sp. KR55 TaxID=3457425 RepID=UPI003FD2C75E
APTGWYPEPGGTSDGPAGERWWDGGAWTQYTRTAGAAAAGAPVRFLVSCVAADRPWADWTAWQLENAGLRVLVLEGNASIGPQTEPEKGERLIALVSPAYVEAVQVLRPWWVMHQEDPEGLADTLVPVVVEPCRPEWPLSKVPYTDLTGLSEDKARTRLLHAVGATPTGRAGPAASPPSFPNPAGRR